MANEPLFVTAFSYTLFLERWAKHLETIQPVQKQELVISSANGKFYLCAFDFSESYVWKK